MPLYFRGAMAPVVQSLRGLPNSRLDSHPRLWAMLAWSLMIEGYPDQIEMAVKLQVAVAALQRCADGPDIQDHWGQVAGPRAWVAVTKHDVPSLHIDAQRAFEMGAAGVVNLAVAQPLIRRKRVAAKRAVATRAQPMTP